MCRAPQALTSQPACIRHGNPPLFPENPPTSSPIPTPDLLVCGHVCRSSRQCCAISRATRLCCSSLGTLLQSRSGRPVSDSLFVSAWRLRQQSPCLASTCCCVGVSGWAGVEYQLLRLCPHVPPLALAEVANLQSWLLQHLAWMDAAFSQAAGTPPVTADAGPLAP